jgi:hypothetical protein
MEAIDEFRFKICYADTEYDGVNSLKIRIQIEYFQGADSILSNKK